MENFGASATFPSSSAYLRLMHWWIFPSLYTTHVMAHLSALWGKTKQFHQVTSRKYYFWNNSSHVVALQNQPLCKRILCFRKEFHHLKVHTIRHGRHHPCLTSVGQALKGSTVQEACRRNLIVNDFKPCPNFDYIVHIYFYPSCTTTRGSLHTSMVFVVACA